MPKQTIEDLNQKYSEADTAGQELFSEQRSNILLVSGDHYQRKSSRFWRRIRDSKDLSEQQKIRLTKNHTQKISKAYLSNILGHAPGVTIVPKNDTDLSDQKSAEIQRSIWVDAKDRYKLHRRIRDWCSDFVNIGEVAVKLSYDPNAGEFLGYEQELDEFGMPMVDEWGRPAADKTKPKFSGGFVFERVFGFNLLLPAEAKDFLEAKYLIVRKMVDKEDLKKQFEGNEEALKSITEGTDDTYIIFDGANGSYKKSDKQVMVREYYFRPSMEYPLGYFFITTPHGILAEGELPFGEFPIVFTAFEELPTSPRGRSMLKQLRPYQAEINRAASKMAEHQITLGDDKLLVQNGTKVTNAGQLPGVRALSYTGMAPTVMPGRDGAQYLAYMQSQISEMYDIAMVNEDSLESEGQVEAFTLLFRSIKQKKKFSTYAEKFEQFLVELCEKYLRLSRHYLSDEQVLQATGKKEIVNIAEFRNVTDGYQIKVEPMTDDIESQMGKQLVLNHVLQYVGPQMGKDDIGKIIRNMPYSNLDQSFNDLTIDYDNATNDILALDRGELPMLNKYDSHQYIIKRLTHRMRQADYKSLSPQVQQNYEQYLQEHEQIDAQQMQEIQRAKEGGVPSGGFLVVCDMYVPKKDNPKETQRARVPYQALEWLIQKLEDQGMSLDKLEGMQQGALADIARMASAPQQGGAPNGMGAQPQTTGQANPAGVM